MAIRKQQTGNRRTSQSKSKDKKGSISKMKKQKVEIAKNAINDTKQKLVGMGSEFLDDLKKDVEKNVEKRKEDIVHMIYQMDKKKGDVRESESLSVWRAKNENRIQKALSVIGAVGTVFSGMLVFYPELFTSENFDALGWQDELSEMSQEDKIRSGALVATGALLPFTVATALRSKI